MKGKEGDVGLLILRIGLGLILLYYGSQKMFGLFGGAGFNKMVENFGKMGFSPLLGTLAIFGEFLGGLGLLVGGLTRVAAFGVFCTMGVATWFNLKNTPYLLHDIFVTGDVSAASKLNYPLFLCIAALAIIFTGGGRYSLDAKLFGRSSARAGSRAGGR